MSFTLLDSTRILNKKEGKTMAIIPPNVHIVQTASYVADTSLTLTVTNSTNITNGDLFIFRCPVTVRDNITGSPVPVSVTLNGGTTGVAMKDKFGLQIQSDKVPVRAYGYYVVPPSTAESTDPYVILLNTPPRVV